MLNPTLRASFASGKKKSLQKVEIFAIERTGIAYRAQKSLYRTEQVWVSSRIVCRSHLWSYGIEIQHLH